MTGARRPIETDPEVIVQNARAIVGDSPIYALVELITNSDDSYDRLEKREFSTSGLIHIEVVRKRKHSIFRVIDQGEGFDRNKMDEKIGRYGGQSSDRGEFKRGYFMRGLKEAMVGVGSGRVRSITDSYFYECEVDSEAYYASSEPVHASAKVKGELGIADSGTEVMLRVEWDEIKIPQFETLKEQLQKYFSLRKILQDPRRIVQLVERDERGYKKRDPVRITYRFPKREKIFDDPIQIYYEGRKIDAHATVYRSEIPLSGKDEAGPYRENGLLISDGRAIHDVSLFKYDNNPDAERLYGEINCPYIYELMKEKEQVVSAKRDALNDRHPFTRAFKEAVEHLLEPIVKDEKKKREDEKRDIETRETKERFRKLLKELDKIANEEVGPEGVVEKREEGERVPAIPENGFAFIPPETTVVSGKIKTLTLRALVPQTIPFNEDISIESDTEEVRVLTPAVTFTRESVREDGIASISVQIEGRQVGALAVITARCGEISTCCLLQVRSKQREDIIIDPPPPKSKGLFRDFKFDPKEDPRYRANYDSSTGIVTIATQAPSVKMYLGPNGENQNERYARVLIAELVTDVVCRELALRKIEKGRAVYPQSNPSEAIYFERAQLVNKYADRIHRIIVA